jgi:hypothetical protein
VLGESPRARPVGQVVFDQGFQGRGGRRDNDLEIRQDSSANPNRVNAFENCLYYRARYDD